MSHVCNETHTTPPTLIYKFLYKKKAKKIFFTHFIVKHKSFLIVQNHRHVPNAHFLVAEFTLKLYTLAKITPRREVVVKPQGDCKLDPKFLRGFTDGEGSFTVSLLDDPRMKIG